MLSKKIAIPIGLLLAAAIYQTVYVNSWHSLYIIPPVILLALIYVFSNEIDWWWYLKHTPQLPNAIIEDLEKNGLYFNSFDKETKQRFLDRLSLSLIGYEFEDKNENTAGNKVFHIYTAYYAVLLSLSSEKFILEPFERIVFYEHPFPSPNIPEPLHNSELNEEDAVLIFNKFAIRQAFGEEKKYFQLALYEYIKVMVLQNERLQVADFITWEQIEEISKFSLELIQQSVRLEKVDKLAVSIYVFILYPNIFKTHFPQQYEKWASFFGWIKNINQP